MSRGGRRVRDTLAAHDLHPNDDACERIVQAVRCPHDRPECVAEQLDREGLALAEAPETRAAAVAVVKAVQEAPP